MKPTPIITHEGSDVDQPFTLVTGCAGFLGSHLSRQLLADGYRILGLDNLSTGNPVNIPVGIDFFQGDASDAGLLAELFSRYRITRIFHCSAFASEGLSHYARELCYRTNILGTAALVNAAVRSRMVNLFCFASSVALYGLNTEGAVETQSPTPTDPYGISKLTSELDLQAAGRHFGLPFLILRLHNLYGPNQNLQDKFRNVIAIYIRNVLLKHELPVFGEGTQVRQFTFIEDVIPLILELSNNEESRNQVINVGAQEATSINDLAALISELAGLPLSQRFFDKRHEAVHCEVSHDRLGQMISGDFQFTSLREGLIRTLEWARRSGDLTLHDHYLMEIEELPEPWTERGTACSAGNY